ncbi:hypothetical protein Cni_G03962 [Canna indica]|uniref:Protein SDA1 n=1 Tax=Canna indica TaxID=4628 RepID=A0AAQ3JVU3_9LILI|nr:hypothetical protein Cni_G03962 [Canna indica]
MPTPAAVSASAATLLSPESLLAAGRSAERLSLPALQSKMKCDPEGYEAELLLMYRHFESSLHLFRHQSALSPSTDPVVSKDLGDLAMFLAHVTPFYLEKLADFPRQVADLLRVDARSLPSSLRCHLAQALILLVNRKIVDVEETLELFMELQIIGDRNLRKLAFSHIIHYIRRMNQKHKNEAKNRKLQNIIFLLLQGEEELRAKRSLVILCDLHRRRVWFDDRTANAICTACFHTSSRVMISALSFLLGYERIEEEDDDEASSSEDDTAALPITLSREAIYKAHHKGTNSSKKKKKAKLQRVMRNIKRQQRIASHENSSSYYSPLTHLNDPQGFVEKLFSRLQKCNERFEIRMMMLKVIARTIGLHSLILLNFYPFIQKYVQPHQRDVTELLAAAVQACHDMVPPDAVEPLFKQIVNQFVHDRSRTEAIAVGLNVVREICLRMPLLMNEDLLQDLVLYKKSHEKAVSTAARSLITLFRSICPSLLVKKDRGRPVNPKARPKAFGEVSVATDVAGIELLQDEDNSSTNSSDAEASGLDLDDGYGSDTGIEDASAEDEEEENDNDSNKRREEDSDNESEEELDDGDSMDKEENDSDDLDDDDEDENDSDEESDSDAEDLDDNADMSSKLEVSGKKQSSDNCNEDDVHSHDFSGDDNEVKEGEKSKSQKRKFVDYAKQLSNSESSLRALKRLAMTKMSQKASDETDGILSNEDFQRIKELKAKKDAKLVMAQQGLLKMGLNSESPSFKIPSSEQLSMKPVDPAKLEVHIKRKLSKEERLAIVRAGREDRGKYQARTAVKQKKTGGLSNRQKEHKKKMPLAAKRAKVARSRQEKKQQKRQGKQFVGRKAWK